MINTKISYGTIFTNGHFSHAGHYWHGLVTRHDDNGRLIFAGNWYNDDPKGYWYRDYQRDLRHGNNPETNVGAEQSIFKSGRTSFGESIIIKK